MAIMNYNRIIAINTKPPVFDGWLLLKPKIKLARLLNAWPTVGFGGLA